jgi:hypothetical protein
MAKRPAGPRAFIDAFDHGDLDLDALRAFDRPVYFAFGGRSNRDYYRRMAERLAAIFPNFATETFVNRHHFDPHSGSSPNASPTHCSHSGNAQKRKRAPPLGGYCRLTEATGSRRPPQAGARATDRRAGSPARTAKDPIRAAFARLPQLAGWRTTTVSASASATG